MRNYMRLIILGHWGELDARLVVGVELATGGFDGERERGGARDGGDGDEDDDGERQMSGLNQSHSEYRACYSTDAREPVSEADTGRTDRRRIDFAGEYVQDGERRERRSERTFASS